MVANQDTQMTCASSLTVFNLDFKESCLEMLPLPFLLMECRSERNRFANEQNKNFDCFLISQNILFNVNKFNKEKEKYTLNSKKNGCLEIILS